MQYSDLNRILGNIDLHLLDQILKGRYEPTMRLLDAGCGEGRNLPYFVGNGFDAWGVDADAGALRLLRMQGKRWGAAFDPEKFVEGNLTRLPFPPVSFDAIVCCAVLHFAQDASHFFCMMDELLRVLRPGGSLFISMNTSAEQGSALFEVRSNADAASEKDFFLLTPALLEQLISRYSFQWLEPLRTVQVNGN